MIFYRYEESVFVDEQVKILEKQFELVKETPCGWWIKYRSDWLGDIFGKKRWVSKSSRKRYAYPTKEEALDSFIARKKRQLLLLGWKVERTEQALNLALQMRSEF